MAADPERAALIIEIGNDPRASLEIKALAVVLLRLEAIEAQLDRLLAKGSRGR